MGYTIQSKGYTVYNPQNRKVETSRDVRFSEDKRYYSQVVDGTSFGVEGVGIDFLLLR